MAFKKFKTVSGYLRSCYEDMICKLPRGDDDARRTAAKAGRRRIVNALLPQKGLPALDDVNEPLLDGIRRLAALGGEVHQVDALKACEKWLTNFYLPMSSVTRATGIASDRSGGVASAAAANSPISFYRGHSVQQVDGSWVVSNNGKLATLPTEQAAFDWISARIERKATALATFKVMGFKRDTHGVSVTMFVDANPRAVLAGEGGAHEVAEALQPDYRFHASQDVLKPVPDAAKNKLFFSDEELYAAAPEHRPPGRRKKAPLNQAASPPAVSEPAPPPTRNLLDAMTAAINAPVKPPKPPKKKLPLTPSPNSIVPSKKPAPIDPQQPELPLHITTVEYGSLEYAFDYFNKALFDGTLPDVMIIYGRRAHSRGHYGPDRYSGRVSEFKKPELSLNPDAFIDRTDEQIVSTLVHEMVHHWQYMFGSPGSRGYHNKQWGQKMIEIGLMPSNTGAVGGKMTGTQMTHYILPDAPFTRAFAVLAAEGWQLNLQSTITVGGSKSLPSKVKFTCPGCQSNMWGKPDSEDACPRCDMRRVPEAA